MKIMEIILDEVLKIMKYTEEMSKYKSRRTRSTVKFRDISILPSDSKAYLQSSPKDSVDFCKGAPGAIPLLTSAIKMFPDLAERLLYAAATAGEITWH